MKRLVLLALLLVGSSPAVAAPRAMTAEESYALGIRYLSRGAYTKALEQLNRVRVYFRDDPYALKAELGIADIHFRKNEWDAARIAYEDFMRAHPRYPELDFVVFRLGLVVYKKAPVIAARDQTWTRQAVNTWAGFAARFPESTHTAEVARHLARARARLARKELLIADFYADRAAWTAVTGRVVPMLSQYPDSPDRIPALGLLGVAQAGSGDLEGARVTLEKVKSEAPTTIARVRLERAIARAARKPAEPAP